MMLKSNQLSFSYGKKNVLKAIDASFESGKVYGILGPNGSGKTTWLRLVGGILTPEKGNITVMDRRLDSLSGKERAKKIAFVPQMFHISYSFSVRDIIMMGRHPHIGRMDTASTEDFEKVQTAITETNLEELADRLVNQLSGGEIQRVLIARALAQDTPIILLDEPVSHLDIHFQQEIIGLLKRIAKEQNKVIITVLHDMNIALNHCDYVFLIKEGEIVEKGSPSRVISQDNLKKVYGVDVSIEHIKDKSTLVW